MSFRRLRRLLLLAVVAVCAYWYYKERPTFSGIIDSLTGPVFKSKAAVKESEHKRVVEEAVPAVHAADEIRVEFLRENMKYEEVRRLLGDPATIEESKQEGRVRVRWFYPRAKRVILFEEGRVRSITVL